MADDGSTATTGVADLDKALGGLYWGDNVVWETDEGGSADPFYAAVAAAASTYDLAAFVSLEHDPDRVLERYGGFEVVDARPGTPFAEPDALTEELRRRFDASRRDLVLFDSFEAMSDRWRHEAATRFFTRTCPLLLELGAIAYWTIVPGEHPKSVRREVHEVTQCVITVGEDRIRIAKAEGRPAGVQGSVYRYRAEDGFPELTVAPAAARLGEALRAVRVNRGLTQSHVARLAGVSPSAISQAERGHRGLSLETLLELTAKLNITLDQLLRGEISPGYVLGRRHDPLERSDGKALPLLDNPEAGLRAYVVRLPPDGSAVPPFAHKGIELVAVASGLVQVVLATGRPVLRPGETLLAERSAIRSWRNLSDSEAIVFWVLRDEASPVAIAAG